MKVYELVGSIGFTNAILSHFSIVLWDNETDRCITVKKPSADEYVQLCGRNVMEWIPSIEEDIEGIDILVPMEKCDRDTFIERK